MRAPVRLSLNIRVVAIFGILLLISIIYFINTYRLSADDWKCIQDEWNGNTTALGTADFHTHFRISFADQEHNFSWIHLPRLNGKSPKILMMVMSRPDGLARRNVLRDTWMNPNMSRIVNDGTMKGIFVCGKGDDMNVMEDLKVEAEKFGDILIADFDDHYLNLPFKTLTALIFAVSRMESVELIGKIDEDVIFYPDQLIPLFTNDIINTRTSAIYGHKYDYGKKVIHQMTRKWHIPEASFKCRMYPPYISGPCYFITRRAAVTVLNTTKFRKLISVEDALITGILATDTDITLKHLDFIYHIPEATSDNSNKQLIAWHSLKSDTEFKRYIEKMRRIRCIACRYKREDSDENEKVII